MPFCDECGKKLEAGNKFCEKCGAKTEISGETKGEKKVIMKQVERKKLHYKEWWFWTIIALFLLVILLYLWIVFTGDRGML